MANDATNETKQDGKMTGSTWEAPWEKAGAWLGGTAGVVALHGLPDGSTQGLFGGRGGLYRWRHAGGSEPADGAQSSLSGIDDPSIVALAVAPSNVTGSGKPGDTQDSSAQTGAQPATAFVSTETGRLYTAPFGPANSASGREDGWREVSSWAGLGMAAALAPSPDFAQDRTLFVGTAEGIYRTLDAGDHWESCNFGLLDTDVLCLTCAPDFGTSELLWAGTAGGGLYRSRNGGRAWRESGIGLADAAVQCLGVSPNFDTDRILYAGLEEQGVYWSQDGGESWQRMGLPAHSVNTLVCLPDGVLLAGTEVGLFRYGPEDATWIAVGEELGVVLSLAAHDAMLLAGTYAQEAWVSQDDGQTWQPIHAPLHAPPLVVQGTADVLFALDADGDVACSKDGGANWAAPASLDVDGIFGIAGGADAQGRSICFAATDGGLYELVDGESWRLVADVPFADHTALAVEVAPNFDREQALLVVGSAGALLISTDRGRNWADVTGPWSGQAVLHARFGPAGPEREAGAHLPLLAVTAQPNEAGHIAINLWKSDDGGRSWATLAGLTSDIPSVLVAWPHDPHEQALYLATQHRLLKFYTTSANELEAHQHFWDEGVRVTALAASPDYEQSGTLWAATNEGIAVSQDRGVTWHIAAALPMERPVVALAQLGARLRAVTLGGQIWYTPLPI